MSTIVLIHGAYQGGWIWGPTARVLRAMGHEVLAPTLDGCAERRHQLRAGISNESHAQELALGAVMGCTGHLVPAQPESTARAPTARCAIVAG